MVLQLLSMLLLPTPAVSGYASHSCGVALLTHQCAAQALQQIMALVSERAPAKPSAAETAADKLLDSIELPPPPGPPPRSASRSTRRERDPKSDDKKEQDIEADFARQRERERHAAIVQQRESHAAYQDLLKQQERHEK